MLAEAVSTISKEFIIADSLAKYNRRCESRGTFFVIDTDGLIIGKVSDYAIDEDTMSVCAVEIMRGYLLSERNNRIWFYSYSVGEGRGRELIVPTYTQSSQCERKEREETCGSRP